MPIKPLQHYNCSTQCDNMDIFKTHFNILFYLNKLRGKAAIRCTSTWKIKIKTNITKTELTVSFHELQAWQKHVFSETTIKSPGALG